MQIPFIEIIESITPDPNLLMWKYEDAGIEIKNGAALTVRESQQVMLLNQGELADIFSAGVHKLSTENIPILTSLRSWKHGFNSPFKVDIYYFNTQQFISLKWGTPAPVIMPDSKFGQVRLRAFGAYNIRIADVARFFRQYAGTYPRLTIFEIERQLRDFIAPKFADVLAQQGYSVMDIAGNMTDLSSKIEPQLQPFFAELGVELVKFQVSSVTLPDEVTKYYDSVTSMNIVGDMDRFQQFNTANAIGQSNTAMNQGTQTAAMMGAMVNQMGQMMPKNQPQPQEDVTGRLKRLKELFEAELIDEQEFRAKKADLLAKL